MDSAQSLPKNIALLPPPGFLGHLIPFIELSKKLVSHHNCTVTLIIPHDGSPDMKPQKDLLHGIPTAITPIFLPPVPTNDLPDDASPEILLPARVIRSLPSLRAVLSATPAAALVVDLFAPHAIDVAREFRIPAYIFYVIAANELSLSINLPKLDKTCCGNNNLEYGDLPEPIELPGSIVLTPDDLPDAMKDRGSEVHKWILDLCNRYLLADGILVNSFVELEPEAFDYLGRAAGGGVGVPPVYPVGPLVRTTETENENEPCLKWLNEQPPKSVLFVSFGSGGTLSKAQFEELAYGLEMSGQRFLWVVRAPRENAAAAYFSRNDEKDPLEYLPQGWLGRVRNRGFVVRSWAPQVGVLSHGSTGGFVTHCGWNSILESVVLGVPLIAWPLCFEHRMNAVFLTEGLKGAMRVRENGKGVVERGQVSEMVKEMMGGEEGKRIRGRMMDAKIAGADALTEGGSSSRALAHIVFNKLTG